jgi:hypothetical protein
MSTLSKKAFYSEIKIKSNTLTTTNKNKIKTLISQSHTLFLDLPDP